MTKGKMVLELLTYAKSAIKNVDQSEASFGSHMTRMEASDWLKFFYSRFGIYEIFKDHLTCGHFLIWALFLKKFSKNPLLGFFQGSLITL